MEFPLVSVIIPTYNRRDSLLRTLSSLTQQTYPADRFEVIVVDDGGSDGTRQIQQQEWPFTLHYHYQENQGIAVARNWAAAQSKADFIAFLDDDIVVNPHYLQALLDCVTESKNHQAIVMATLLPPPDMPETLFHHLYIAHFEGEHYQIEPQLVTIPFPFYDCTGGVILLPRSAYLKLGQTQVLPQGGGTSWGGLDLAYRAYKVGFQFFRAPKAKAIHYDYAIQDMETYRQRMQRVGRYAVLLLQKYPELEQLVPLFHDRSFANWRSDPPNVILRKLWRSVMAWPMTMAAMDKLIALLEKQQTAPTVLKRLYIWIISSSITIGMRQGIREFGGWRQGHHQK